MKFKNIMLSLSLILVALLCLGCVAASEDTNLTDDSSILEINDGSDCEFNDEMVSASENESLLSASKTIEVDNYGDYHREMNDHTIQNAIDDKNTNDGDTIIIRGDDYDHVHVTINKRLTIKSDVGTKLRPCSSSAVSGYQGIFYLTPEASGSVIEGFTFNNDMFSDNGGYEILMNGASNVTIRNCKFDNDNAGDSIRIVNGNNIQISNVEIKKANIGIKIKDSQEIYIKNSNILDNKAAGISIEGNSKYITVSDNNITNSYIGVSLTSSDNMNILSNYIALNTQYGVYIDCQVVQINIIGNFFYYNSFREGGEVYNGPNAQGFFKEGGEKYEVVNNNYFVGNYVRPVHSANGASFLGYAFELGENSACPVIHFRYEQLQWSDGNYRLQFTNVTQVKKGEYSISLVDANGNAATGLSSVPITFYINKNNNLVAPQEGDVYKTVMMKDGTATVRFSHEDFNETGNVITAVSPGTSLYLTGDQGKNVRTFVVDDSSIPGSPTPTKFSVANLNTYSNSNVDYTITLTDIYNNPVADTFITYNLNSKDVQVKTDSKGQAKIKINQNPGTYTLKVSFAGDGYDYDSSSAEAKITVTKLSTKILASNYAMLVKKANYYKLTLKDSSNNPVSNQKVSIKVNKKSYTVKTNAKGEAKVKLKLKKGNYNVVMNYKGSNKYEAAKKTTKITVKKTLKTKLSAPKITTTPKTSTKYVVTLKDQNGNAIKKQKVTVIVNGKKYTKKTNSKGQVTINVKFSKLTSYKVKATYKGSKVYKKSSANGKITVKKTATVISAPNMETNPNVAIDYTVTLKTASGSPIAKQNLKITLDGKTYTKTTNNNGQVTIQTKFATENNYKATVTYAGSTIYKNADAVGTVKVSRVQTRLFTYDRTFSNDSADSYIISLKDSSGKALSNEAIDYILNGKSYTQNTDANGQVKVNISALDVGSYDINVRFNQTNQYGASQSSSKINILNKSAITFVDAGLANDEIQNILNNANYPVEFLGYSYDEVSLIFNRPLDVTFQPNTTLNGKEGSPVLTIAVSNFKVSNLTINSKEGSGIKVISAENVTIENNNISNALDQSKIDKYNSGELIIPGDGIVLSNANGVMIINNDIKSFGNAIFAQNSDDVEISNNTLSLSNYGINYGLGVKNTNISHNLITKNIGLYVMDVPEGPLGYGIFLNQSAVNVSIINNRILDNYMGISVDANYSTGIVILQNWISDNALEGIRFNAGYDLAENAVEPDVNDNAIYRNARGPSMMILGELSANPNGIYHYGEFNVTKRLQLGTNWYGRNARITWDYATNTTGYGTMCPRIATTYISVKEIEVVSPGTYQVKFYNNDTLASRLPKFEMFASLNDDVEIKFYVVNGIGTFSFDSGYKPDNNVIKVSVGSLKDEYRTFEVLLNKTLSSSEIPV